MQKRQDPERTWCEASSRSAAAGLSSCQPCRPSSFTGAEIRDLSEGRGALLERLPDAAARERVRQTVLKLHSGVTQPEPSPWHARHVAIARSHGLTVEHDRQHERSRGLMHER